MPDLASFQRFTFRVVLLKVSPLVVRLVSVPDDLSLEELHEVLQLTFVLGAAVLRLGPISRVRSPFDGPPVDRPKPCSIDLTTRDLSSDVTIKATR